MDLADDKSGVAGALLLVAGVVVILGVLAGAHLAGFNPVLFPGLLVIGAVLVLVGFVLLARVLSGRRGPKKGAVPSAEGPAPGPSGPSADDGSERADR